MLQLNAVDPVKVIETTATQLMSKCLGEMSLVSKAHHLSIQRCQKQSTIGR